MSKLICNKDTIFSTALTIAEKCQNLAPICDQKLENVQFFKYYFCDLNQNNLIASLICFVTLLYLIKFICSTVDEYIAPGIVYLTEYLKISEALAGVTLLAFANGAGDVITAIIASDSAEGISYNIGALYGAGLFVLTVVVGKAILASPKEVKVDSSIIYRDIGLYIIATLMTLVFAIYGKITWWTSFIMLMLYFLLVIIVLIQDSQKKKEKEETMKKEDEEVKGLNALMNDLRNILMNSLQIVKNKKKLRQEEEGEMVWIDYLDLPFHWIRILSIPPCNDEEFDYKYMIIWPILGIQFLVYQFFNQSYWNYLIAFPPSLVLSYVFFKKGDKKWKEVPKNYILVVLLGIFMGILWSKFCCELLVNLLTFIGILTGLSSTYLGLTIIAMGNALPDGLTTIAIARKGQAVMGLTGGIAGQLFGLLVGFGMGMLKKSIKEGDLVFDLFDLKKIKENFLDLVVVGVTFSTLCFIFFYGIYNKLVFDKKMAYVLYTVYILFIFVTTIYAFKEAFF